MTIFNSQVQWNAPDSMAIRWRSGAFTWPWPQVAVEASMEQRSLTCESGYETWMEDWYDNIDMIWVWDILGYILGYIYWDIYWDMNGMWKIDKNSGLYWKVHGKFMEISWNLRRHPTWHAGKSPSPDPQKTNGDNGVFSNLGCFDFRWILPFFGAIC